MTLVNSIEEGKGCIKTLKTLSPKGEWGIRKAPMFAHKKYQVYRIK